MTMKTSKAAAHHKRTALGMQKLASTCSPEDSRPLPEIQTDFLAARFGLDGARARVVAELAWGR